MTAHSTVRETGTAGTARRVAGLNKRRDEELYSLTVRAGRFWSGDAGGCDPHPADALPTHARAPARQRRSQTPRERISQRPLVAVPSSVVNNLFRSPPAGEFDAPEAFAASG